MASFHAVIANALARKRVPRPGMAVLWLANTSANLRVPYHHVVIHSRAILGRTLTLAGFAIPGLGNRVTRSLARLWFGRALTFAVISVQVLTCIAFLTFSALALARFIIPLKVFRAIS